MGNAEERKQQILLERIEQLPRDVYNYVKLKIFSIDDFTDKAFQISYAKSKNINALFEALWIPAWALKKDNNNDVWMLKAFYERKAAEEKYLERTGKRRLEMMK